MKVRFNRQEMADALSLVCVVAASRTPKPILQSVRLEVHKDFMLLAATDLELGIRCTVTQVEVDKTGDTLVAADTLSRIVHESTDDVLNIEQDGNLLHVRGGDSHFQIVTQEVSDFPAVASFEGSPDFTSEFAPLRRLIEWTVFAAARENTRYAINGVLWVVEDGKLTLAATDGRRLSCGKVPLTLGDIKPDWQAIVPVKALSLLGRIPGDPDAEIGIKMVGSQLLFQGPGVTLSTALVEGRFPNYRDVIPADCDKQVELNTVEFQSALKRAALLTNEESKGVRLAFDKNKLTISSRAPEQGEVTISLPIEFDSEPLEIGFNPVFILDVLRVAHTETVLLFLKEQNRPGIVRIGDDLLYVVMPVNLS